MRTVPVRRRRRILAAAAAVAILAGAAGARAEPRAFEIDPDHFFVTFLVGHAGFSSIVGSFLRGEGRFVYDEDTRTLQSGSVTIYAKSVFTDHSQRDKRLRGADFLDVSEHPEIVFEASTYQPTSERGGKLSGQLTMRDETRSVTFDITVNRVGKQPSDAGMTADTPYVLGASARTTIARSDWGMTHGTDEGLLADEIELIIELEAHRQAE